MLSKKQSKLASSRARDDVVTPQGPSSSVPHRPVRFPPEEPPSPARSPSTYARPPPVEGERLLTKAEVVAMVGMSFVTVWRMMRAGTFPRSRLVRSRPMWLNSELSLWFERLPRVPLKGDAP